MTYRPKTATVLKKHEQLRGEARRSLAQVLASRYTAGETLRQIAEDIGRSYGFVNNIVHEGGATMRTRGGPRPGPRKRTTRVT